MQKVVILDFDGQYKELIVRRARECGVDSVVLPWRSTAQKIKEYRPIGIILSGGPHSVYKPDAPIVDVAIFTLGVPILGVCYGMQMMSQVLGGEVRHLDVREYGMVKTDFDLTSLLFDGLGDGNTTLMSHNDGVVRIPQGFRVIATTADCDVAAIEDASRRLYGVQFHPEVGEVECGRQLFYNFLTKICGAIGEYSAKDHLDSELNDVRLKVGNHKVVLAIGSGIESFVTAKLLNDLLPDQVVCVYVDNGFIKEKDISRTESFCKENGYDFVRLDARKRFVDALRDVEDAQEKRMIIGGVYTRIFEELSAEYEDAFFAKCTIYSSVIESGVTTGEVIKTHHDVSANPSGYLGVIEPLRYLFADEVREIATSMGFSDEIIGAQAFSAVGYAVRCVGKVTPEKLDILKKADDVFCQEVERARLNYDQYFAVLTSVRSVGVMGDGRTYDFVLALRAVHTNDFMTGISARIPYEVLDRVTSRIVNEVDGISRIVYDVTGKPPATIEWE